MIPLERAFRVLRVHMYIIRVAYIQSGIIVMIDDPMEDLSILGSGNRATLASFYSGDVPCPRVWSFPSLPLPSVTLSKTPLSARAFFSTHTASLRSPHSFICVHFTSTRTLGDRSVAIPIVPYGCDDGG